MKKILAFLSLLLLAATLVFSLSSCGVSPEDIKKAKDTADLLEFNFFEVELLDEKKISAAEAEVYSAIVKAEKDEDKITIYYFKKASDADKKFTDMIKSEDALDCGKNGKIVYVGTSHALKCATKKLWGNQLYHTFIEDNNYLKLVKGFGNTLLITLGALLIGVVIGAAIAIAKYYAEGNPKLRIVNALCDIYTTVIRGIPVTVLLLIFFYIILVSTEGVLVAIIAFGINSGAYMAELVRSGINAVDKGQMEAARSLGMSKWQAMRTIVLPQAIKNILPAIGNECIALLKETSVAGYVAVMDLTRAANLIRNNTFDAINPLVLLALTYLILVILMTKGLSILERRLSKSGKH